MGSLDKDDGMDRQQKISGLAGAITQMHAHALANLGDYGVTWWDIAYAGILALRGLGTMNSGGDMDKADAELADIFRMAMDQEIVAKKFRNEEEAAAWARSQGIDMDEAKLVKVPVERGPMH
jgi:hypothetical protein